MVIHIMILIKRILGFPLNLYLLIVNYGSV